MIRSGVSELVPEISEELLDSVARDELHGQLLRQLELRSYMCVPLKGRDRVLGAITFISTDSAHLFGRDELIFAEELARRAASAIENARLYREAEARAQAARVLATIGDGVLLVDATDRVRLWNPAAERITGIGEQDVVGRVVADAIPGWGAVEWPLRIAQAGEAVRAETRSFPSR